MGDPSALNSLWVPSFRAVGIGWTLHRQGQGYFETAYYRELEIPLDSCWVLDAMIGDGGRSIAFVALTRPRSAKPFTVDDVQRLDPLRPWLAHAFRPAPLDTARTDEAQLGAAGAPVTIGEMILTADGKIVFQTNSLEFLLRRVLAREPGDYTRHVPVRDQLPAPILKFLRQIVGAANGSLGEPPGTQVSTAYGVVTLEAKWLVPAGALPADVAKDPKSCLIAVTIALREHAIAYAARVLRESGATPPQLRVGLQLAMGKSKPAIADELGIKPATVADLTKKLYQSLDVHNSVELGMKIWLQEQRNEARGFGLADPRATIVRGASQARSALGSGSEYLEGKGQEPASRFKQNTPGRRGDAWLAKPHRSLKPPMRDGMSSGRKP
jgi:DNA-binding CsgD family transcriptional regulator